MRVLLIEDDKMVGAAVEQALRDAAYAVDWVTDGETAIHAAENEAYEVALLDLGLPEADGREVLRRFRALGRKLPVIIVTARDGVDDRIDGLDLGADDYLVKPFEIRELLARMRAVLRRQGSGVVSRPQQWQASPRSRNAGGLLPWRDIAADRPRIRTAVGAAGAAGHDPVAQRARTADLRLERGGREQRDRVPDPHDPEETGSHGDPKRARRRLDGGPPVMTASLRARLFVGLTAIILLAGCVGGVFSYFWAFDEAIEMQDFVLIQIGSLLQNGSVKSDQIASRRSTPTRRSMLSNWGRRLAGRAEERQLWSLQDGLHVASLNGRSMRVLLRTRPDGSRFAVLQPTDVRDDIAGNMALRTLLPIAALVPCLLLVTALVIARSLRPMVRLAGDLDSRRADDMTPLPLVGTPSELQPFIASINGLLDANEIDDGSATAFRRRCRARTANAHHRPQPASRESRPRRSPRGGARASCRAQGRHGPRQASAGTIAGAGATRGRSVQRGRRGAARPRRQGSGGRRAAGGGAQGNRSWLRADRADRDKGEPVMVATMVRNLIDNAVRFTPDGGRVDIGVYRDGDEAVLQIEDTGPGIPPGDIDRIFEPFFRGSRADRGWIRVGPVDRQAHRRPARRIDRAGEYVRPDPDGPARNRASPRRESLSASTTPPRIDACVRTPDYACSHSVLSVRPKQDREST